MASTGFVSRTGGETAYLTLLMNEGFPISMTCNVSDEAL